MVRATILSITLANVAVGGDWPRFRGPNGSSVADEPKVPTEWKNAVRWSVPLPGGGISSPVVSGGNLYLTFCSADGVERSLWCLDAKTGQEKWRRSHAHVTHKLHKKNTFATGTPAASAGAVVVTFGDVERYTVVAYSEAGDKLWERDLGGFNAGHGCGASPIVYGDRVIVVKEQDGDSVIVSYELKTGAEQWRTNYRVKVASYSTPTIVEGAQGPTLVCSHSFRGLAGYGVEDGKLRWECTGFENRTVNSPIVAKGLVLATAGEGNSGKMLLAVDPQGTSPERAPAYKLTERLPYCPSLVEAGDRVYFVTDMGVLRCLDAATGKEVYTQRLGGKFSASPVRIGDRMFLAGEEGDVHVVKVGDKFARLAVNKLADGFLATPAVADGRMYLRGDKKLWCIGAE